MANSGIYLLNLGLGLYESPVYNENIYEEVKVSGELRYRALKAASVGTYLDPYTSKSRLRFENGKNGVVWKVKNFADPVTIDWVYPSKDGSRKYPFSVSFEMDYGVDTEVYERWFDKYKVDGQKNGNQYFHGFMAAIEDSVITQDNKTYLDHIVKSFGYEGILVRVSGLVPGPAIGYAAPSGVNYIKNNQLNQSFVIEYYDTNSNVPSPNISKVVVNSAGGGPSKEEEQVNPDSPDQKLHTPFRFKPKWVFRDSSFIVDIKVKPETKNLFTDYTNRLNAQNTPPPPPGPPEEPITVSTVGEEEAQKFHSGLEYFIRSIQLYGLTDFLDKGKGNLLRVKEIDLYKGGGPESFIVQAFSNGVLSSIVDDLGKDKSKYKDINKDQNRQKLMYAYASYGFNHNLMGTSDDKLDVPQVDFNALFKAWAVPYKLNEGVVNHTDINYPIYIKLGLLLMIINHMCTIYDSESGETVSTKEQVPLLYIDFNPETNICLSEPLQMSMDPFKFLIPFRGTNEEYISLFDDSVITRIGGKAYVGPGTDDDAGEELFKPQPEDVLSAQLPEFKDPHGDDAAAYRGYIMNALVNTDYILNLCRNFASNNESQAVYLKPFLQQLVTDLNKSLGDINLFRIAYSDTGNCLHIVDDQVCPQHPNEKTYLRAQIDKSEGANYTLPLFGYNSIAKSISINTEVSSRLANMIAISSNSNQTSDAGKDGSPFGHMNVNFLDRYKTQTLTTGASSGKLQKQYDKLKNEGKTEDEIVKIMGKPNVELVKAEQLKKRDINQAAKSSAKMFNAYVRSCFSTNSPSADDVSSATNYYIERMNKRKSENSGTRSSAMIPVSVQFKTDGLSGLAMGHAFVLPEELLPNTYSNAFSRGKEKKENKRIGFVVIGLNNTLQGNIWETTVKANMIYLKDEGDFVGGGFNRQPLTVGDFIGTPQEDTTDTNYSNTSPASNFPATPSAYPNVKYSNIGLGNPASDKINPNVLKDVSDAAVKAGVTVSVTTAVSGHHSDPPSRHTYGQAVDIAIVDGVSVRPNASNRSKVDAFVQQLIDLGYTKNSERGNTKAVLTFGFPGHDNHVHVSNKA